MMTDKPGHAPNPDGYRLLDVLIDPFRMIRDIRAELSRAMGLWGPALNIPQVVGGIVFINRAEGAVILIAWALMIGCAGFIHRHMPFSKLTGICQVWWLPVLPWLIERALSYNSFTPFVIWLWYVIITMTISLILDVIGVYQYIATDNKHYRRRYDVR